MKEVLRSFLTTLRSFRTSSLLNVIGLAVAFASLYIIVVQINHDLFYNHDIVDSERVYRLEFHSHLNEGMYTASSDRVVPETCIKNIAAVEACACGNLMPPPRECTLVRNGDLLHFQFCVSEVSLDFIKTFSLQSVLGDVNDIAKPNTLAVSESVAAKMGAKVGDDVYLNTKVDDDNHFQIVAVFKDSPLHTDLSKLEVIQNIGDKGIGDYNIGRYNYYIKLRSPSDKNAVTSQAIAGWKKIMLDMGIPEEHFGDTKLRLVPMSETYFQKDTDGAGGMTGNRGTTYTLIAVAALIVAIAFINFINFFFALAPIRIRTINTHKIFGCSILKLRSMLVFESIGLVALALAVSVFVVMLFQNSGMSKFISTSLSFGANINVVMLVIVLALLLALFTSLYPAYYITSFPTAMAIKGSFGTSKQGRRFRYVLVGLQFTISIALIICALFVRLQYNYMMRYDMGFNKELVLTANLSGKISQEIKSRDAFNSKLLSNHNIKDVAWGSGYFVSDHVRMGLGYSRNDTYIHYEYYPVSWNFLRFMGIKVLEGRDFVESDELKLNGTYIFNETAKKAFALKANDKMISPASTKDAEIAGFCRDFHYMPLQHKIEPFALYVYGSNSSQLPRCLYLRTSANANVEEVISYVKDAVVEADPDMYRDGVDVRFFDDNLQQTYRKEQKLSSLISIFSLLAIIISLMGVFGLVMFETHYRMKEIAVRRVYGASVNQILKMFNLKFVYIVAACFVVAAPVSYMFVRYWLEAYTSRVPIYWWVFGLALFIVLIITVITVTARSYSAATSDPAKLVKTE